MFIFNAYFICNLKSSNFYFFLDILSKLGIFVLELIVNLCSD
ncbi:hypothetical protein BGAFAR04_0686 [Borreliella garinii Far04]|nr:hypothetical protein BGAFAR04_0686 [Borreliella garinii Far04]